MKVRGPDGRTWRVTRRWTPWRRRFREVVDPALPDSLDGADDLLGLLVVALVALVVLPLLLTVAFVVVELLLLAVLLPFAVLGRVLLGRRWVVEVREGFRPRYEEVTGDWGTASRRIAELADGLRDGSFTVPRDPEGPGRVVRRDPGPPPPAPADPKQAW